MANFKDICKKYDATILQQLYKKIVTDSGTQDKNVFPIALVQGVYDAISGMRLDDILTHYNYINIRYGGTQEATRLLIPIAHRRKLLIIAYTDYDGNSYIEQYIGETINDNDWKASDNWKTPFTKGNFMVNLTDAQLEKYINKYFETHDMSGLIQQGITINFNQFINSEEGQGFLNNVATTIIQQYVADNLTDAQLEKYINKYFETHDMSGLIQQGITINFNQFINSEEGQGFLNNVATTIIQQYVADNLTDAQLEKYINKYFETHDMSGLIQQGITINFNQFINSEEGQGFLNNVATTIIQQYVADNLSEETLANIINTYLADNIQTICNTFFNSDAGKQAINEAIAPQLEEIVGEYFTALSTFVEDNERVIANALARHEQAITDLQN